MAIIKPFKALRPPKELAPRVAALPYDVMNVDEARQMAAGNPYSFLHVSRPEIDLPPEIDPYHDSVYAKGRENMGRFILEGTLVQDPRDFYYVYRQKMGSVTQTGLVVCAGVDDYQSGVIKKHELTRPDKEEDRVKHIDQLDANDEPVFYAYRKDGDIDDIISAATAGEPENDFVSDDGVAHTLWVIRDAAVIRRLTDLFAAIGTLYVADGHHRSAAAGRVRELRRNARPGHTGSEEYNFFLTVIFPDDQLRIMPYNRAVRDLNGMTSAEFLAALEGSFQSIKGEGREPQRHEFGLYLDGAWSLLRTRDGVFDRRSPAARLDVSILQNSVLGPLLGIANPRTDKRINFIGGIRGTDELQRLVDGGEFRVAFALHPTSIEDLMELADAGEIMPPKSTWFEPKLRSGLFIHLLS
jgi:uncharacterized protein (DUF1015 family)